MDGLLVSLLVDRTNPPATCLRTHFRFSFLHTEDGAIGEVRYPPGEDVHVINIKKGLVASLLSRPAPEVRRCEMVT